MSYASISAKELYDKALSGQRVELIDVRTPAEFREVHASLARNVPFDSLDPRQLQQARNGSANQPLYVICQGGHRSTKACDKLVAAGCTQIINVEGGTRAWEAAGLPVVRGQKAVSIERQVRMAAGLLVLAGSLLAYFVHPAWAALPGAVGAGLFHAGLTDSCAMGMLFTRMPWNQTSCCEGK